MKAQTIFSAFINCVIFENKQALDIYVPSTKDVSKVTFVDFLRPAGNFKPIRSNWSRNVCPPFFDFALKYWNNSKKFFGNVHKRSYKSISEISKQQYSYTTHLKN